MQRLNVRQCVRQCVKFPNECQNSSLLDRFLSYVSIYEENRRQILPYNHVYTLLITSHTVALIMDYNVDRQFKHADKRVDNVSKHIEVPCRYENSIHDLSTYT